MNLAGSSKTFEDLPILKPNIFFHNHPNGDPMIKVSPSKSNKSTEGVRRQKPPLYNRGHVSISGFNNDLHYGQMNQMSAKSISNHTKQISKYHMEFYKG